MKGIIVFCICFIYWCNAKVRQERAVVDYFNPKYISEAELILGTHKNGQPDKTDAIVTTLHSWGNNVTYKATVGIKGIDQDIAFAVKICDMTSHQWLVDFVKSFANLELTCPMPAGTYKFKNMEIPPKNFPLPLTSGYVYFNVSFYMTDTQEKLYQASVLLHILQHNHFK